MGVAGHYVKFDQDTAAMVVCGAHALRKSIIYTNTCKGQQRAVRTEVLKSMIETLVVDSAYFLGAMYGSSYLLK